VDRRVKGRVGWLTRTYSLLSKYTFSTR